MTIPDLAPGYKRYALHERGMRPKSYCAIMASVTQLCEFLNSENLHDLTNGGVRAFLCWGREERLWEARTFRNHRQYLKSFFAWCVLQGHLAKNPVDGIEKPKLPRRLPRALTRENTQKILNQARWYPWHNAFEGVRNETMLYFLVYTGVRLQEMLDLKCLDVNLESSEILIRQGKGQKDRLVPIHPVLARVLRNYLAARRDIGNHSKYLFTGYKSELPLSGKDVRSMCGKVGHAAGVYFTPHMLRHTFGRLAVEANIDIFQIREIMGHTDITTTQIYLSCSISHKKGSISRFQI